MTSYEFIFSKDHVERFVVDGAEEPEMYMAFKRCINEDAKWLVLKLGSGQTIRINMERVCSIVVKDIEQDEHSL